MTRACTVAALLIAGAVHASGAGAQQAPQPPPAEAGEASSREEARTLGYAGVRAYGQGDYAAASEQLERSFALLPVPSLGLWSARALVKRGKLVEAEQRYRTVVKMRVAADDSDVQQAALETAQAELLELLPRIPTLRVQIAGARPEDVSIMLDGTPLPLERWRQGEPVNPGPHQIAGAHLGEQVLLEITAGEGRESEALLTFAARPAAHDVQERPPAVVPSSAPVPGVAVEPVPTAGAGARAWQLGGWSLAGAGGLSLGASAISYLLARAQLDELRDGDLCQGQRCQPSRGLDRYEDLRAVYLTALVGGLALGAAGATILILEPGAPDTGGASGGWTLRLGLGTAELRARF